MFSLVLTVCIGAASTCQQVETAALYQTMHKCEQQGHIIAGTVRGRYTSSLAMRYSIRCPFEQDPSAPKVEQILDPVAKK